MSKVRVLFCDDSAGVVKGFEKNVAQPLADAIEAVTAASVAGVKQLVERGESFDVVVTDLNFDKVGGGPKDGLEVIRIAREEWPGCEAILMTAYEGSLDVRDGQRLARWGVGEDALLAKTDAEDPGTTWLRLRERIHGLALKVRSTRDQVKELKQENRFLRESFAGDSVEWVASRTIPDAARELREDAESFLEGQAGRSFAMRETFRKIRRAAMVPSDVLILGATGTGKDLVARAIHALSPRAKRPYVKADLTTTSGNLVESELFGHEKGAFTGADTKKEGLIAAAEGGTFFLDEIGNVSPDIQAKLLRVLEDRKYRSLGSTRDRTADVRFIAATNLDLTRAVDDGKFRADLYERLNVVRVELPSLVDRLEDVPLLAVLFLDEFRKKFRADGFRRIDADALRLLMDQDWPRNVRQLKHAMERLFSEIEPETETVTRDVVARVIEAKPARVGGEVLSGADVFRRIVACEFSLTLADLKRKYGEEVVKDVVRRAMIHFRGLPDGDECAQYFGGSTANAWRQFAFQLGITWKSVRGQ